MGRHGYPPEFRCKVWTWSKPAARSLIGRDLEISEQTIYTWRRQGPHRPRSGSRPDQRRESRTGCGQEAKCGAGDRTGRHPTRG